MQQKRNNSFLYINLLRIIGAICIAIFLHYEDHLLPNLGIANPLKENPIWGYICSNSCIFVEMFFMVSGILFSFSYLNKIIQGMS